MIPSKKELELMLSTVKGFEKPKPWLEQYTTPSGTAAELLWIAFMNGNIKDKIVVDLGCGTGIFSFGAALLGAKKVYAYDLDEEALAVAKTNYKIIAGAKLQTCDITFTKKEINDIKVVCDTVIMNPPFGVQKRGADQVFLKKAFEIADAVYSVHKFETGEFLQKFAEENNFSAILLSTNLLKLPATMEFHKQRRHEVRIGLWRFDKIGT